MFSRICIGQRYSRPDLAQHWGYAGYQALARGVVTPRDTNKIILFVTLDKQADLEQYEDRFDGDALKWEGPTDHFAEDRMIDAAHSNDEMHLFCRRVHHTDFTYCGPLELVRVKRLQDRPSRFTFRLTKGPVNID